MVIIREQIPSFWFKRARPKEDKLYDREFKNLRNKNICPFS
jgi:hypothetical protein